MPSRKKGWKVLVFKYILDDREFWWAADLYDDKKREHRSTLLRSAKRGRHGPFGEPPLRRKSAFELTQREAKRAFADAKRTGQEVKLINAQGVTVKHANQRKRE